MLCDYFEYFIINIMFEKSTTLPTVARDRRENGSIGARALQSESVAFSVSLSLGGCSATVARKELPLEI